MLHYSFSRLLWLFEVFCVSIQTVKNLNFSSVKNAIGNLIGIALNLQITLGSIVTFILLILPIQEHDISLHLFMSSSNSFINVLQFFIYSSFISFSSIQFSSVSQSCPTLCDPMNHSTPGLPGHHQLPEFTQNHVHRVGDAIQPSHPLSSPSPPAPNPSQHQCLFQ